MNRSLALCFLMIAACSKSDPAPATGSAGPMNPAGSANATASDAAAAGVVDAAPIAEISVDAPAAIAGPAAPPDAAVDDEVESRFADVLTGQADSDPGDMSKRRPGTDLGQQIDDVRRNGRNVAIGSGRSAPADPGPGPSGRVSVASKQTFDDSSLTADVVLAKIQRDYMTGIKRCYKNALKKDPAMRGKMKLDLTVNEVGRTVNGKAKGFSAELDECVTGLMSSWRFPIPKDADSEPTDATFSIALTLVPD